MARARGKLAIAHLAQLAAHGRLGDTDAERLEQPLAEVDDAPAHDAVDRRRRALLDDVDQSGALLIVEERRLHRRLAVHETFGPQRVEAQDPVADDLERHPADLGRLAARRAVVNRRQRQEATRLRPILRALGQSPKSLCVKVFP